MNEFLKKSGVFCINSWDGLDGSPIHFNGICYYKNSIIIGEDSFREQLLKQKMIEIKEGRFTAAFPLNNSEWIITNDESGQGLLFYYDFEGSWAVSNSFLYLIEFLKLKKIGLTFNKKTVLGFFAFHSTTEQLVSHSTLVEEVKLLSYEKYFKVSNNKLKYCDKNKIKVYNYEEELIYFKNIWASRLGALSNKFNGKVSCDLTGGYDSRTVFGLLLASDVEINKINVRSNRYMPDDYSVAKKISEHYSFNIRNGNFKHKINCSAEINYKLWKYGNLGVYFPVYFQINDYKQTSNIQLHGAGGEGLRGTIEESTPLQLVNRLVNRIKNKYSKKEVSGFIEEFLLGTKQAGISNNENINHKYYNYYRSRYHFGRNNFRGLYSNLITPLNSMHLHALKDSIPKFESNTKIYSDLMLLCNRDLPFFDFDNTNRNFSLNQVESSPFFNGQHTIDHFEISIHCNQQCTEESSVQNDVSVQELFCQELFTFREDLINNGDITRQEIENLIFEIKNNKNLSLNLKKASFLYSLVVVKSYCVK